MNDNQPVGGALFPGEYKPDWIEEFDGFVVGITIDDSCLMVLNRDEWGYWIPATHIPLSVAVRLGDLAQLERQHLPTGRYTWEQRLTD